MTITLDEQMEADGVVSSMKADGTREILVQGASQPKQYAYSRNQENYHGSYDSADDAAVDAMIGCTDEAVWVGEVNTPTAHEFLDVDNLIDDIMARAGDECGEFAEDWLSTMSRDKKQELAKLIGDWLEANEPPTFFLVDNVQFVNCEDLIGRGLLTRNGATFARPEPTKSLRDMTDADFAAAIGFGATESEGGEA